MKWLLITTLGTNPGDEFARIGVQNLIREVDKEAEFDLLNKENPDHYYHREFDRAVICGMPLFWATEQDNYDIWWWDKIFEGWIAEDRRKFMALGVGHVLLDDIPRFAKYCFSINYVIGKVWALTAREPILDHPKIIESICPSAFATERGSGNRSLCNFMVNNGHFPNSVSDEEGRAWMTKQQTIIATLQNRGFEFMAHTDGEHRLAHDLGWDDRRIHHYTKPEEYLRIYSEAGRYFGQRLHGAAVVAALGGNSWGVAFDSRIKMVRRLGGWACRPSEFTLNDFRLWENGIMNWIPQGAYDIRSERDYMIRLLREFAS